MWGGLLRDDPNNGCKGDYLFAGPSMLLASKEAWMTSFGWFSTFHEDLLP